MEIVTKAQEEILRRLKSQKELTKMKTSEISSVAEASTKRYTIFRGNATDKN